MIVEKPLVKDVQLTTSAAEYYVTTSKVVAVITKATICNTTGGLVSLTVYLVSPGGSPSAANTIISGLPIPPGKSWDLYPLHGQALETAGASIQALAGSNSALSLRISGYELPA